MNFIYMSRFRAQCVAVPFPVILSWTGDSVPIIPETHKLGILKLLQRILDLCQA